MTWTPSDLRERVPDSLAWLQASEAGRRWLRELAQAAEECLELWRLRPGEPFPDAYVSLALPVTAEDGADAVLKLQYFPDRESEHEALALERWAGEGAVRLLGHDPDRHALLIERCLPGTPLADLDLDRALDVLIKLLPRLWKPVSAPPFTSLGDEAGHWAAALRASWEAAGRPFEERLVGAAAEILDALPASQGQQVLLHQDLHALNVLAAQREPWLVIDPKPLAGEREFSLAPIVRSTELGHGRREALRRLDRLSSELGLDRERARLWCIAQTLAWSIGDGVLETHVETARWLLDAV